MKRRKLAKLITTFIMFGLLTGCGASGGTPDDYATNEDYTSTEGTATSTNTTTGSSGISKDSIKVGVLYISDPSEGSGYSYTHDLGIQGMQENLGLDSDQIVRKIADDGDAAATEKAIKDCISEGCNIIFTTSWGYMETTAALAEQYPDVYFSHGTGYLSNGKNFNNYFGRIYQARYLSGIVAGMNTKSNKIGYVAAQDSSNSEVTGGIDAFAIGVESVNSDAQIYVVVTNSWYDPDKEKAASEKLLDMGCDVMAQHCDTPYPQTLAQERGVYGIGYNSDMSKETPDCKVSVFDLEDEAKLKEEVANADILVNATLAGMKPHEDVTLIDKSLFRKDLVVADTVYNPEKTKMILEAEEAGCQAIGGKGMLLYQGVVNYSLFTGKDFPIEEYQKFQAEQAK